MKINTIGHLVKTNPIRTQYEPNQTQNKPNRTQNKPETKPKQTQSNPIPPHDSTTIISAVFSKYSLIKILIRLQITYNMIVSVVLSEFKL